MKYKLIAFDHDDTLVNSTPVIHYPSFVKFLSVHRPHTELSMDEFLSYSFDPGFAEMCTDILGFTDEEMKLQYQSWLEDVKCTVPTAFPGVKELLLKLRGAGAMIAVVSHSFEENIYRDFDRNSLPLPDAVFGWTMEKEKRKPSAYPLNCLMERFNVSAEDILVVDDLRPGRVMADRVGAQFAGAGWGYDVPALRTSMRSCCDEGRYFTSIREFEKYLFGE